MLISQNHTLEKQLLSYTHIQKKKTSLKKWDYELDFGIKLDLKVCSLQ